MVSEDFSLSLLNPVSVKYKENTRKYSTVIRNTYKKSHLADSFVKVIIDGFSSGSVNVFFKIILDKKRLPGRTTEDPAMAAKDVFVQEIMSLGDNEFEGDVVDLDSIEFSLSAVQDITKQYLDPEPYSAAAADNPAPGSLWQSLARSTARPAVTTEQQLQEVRAASVTSASSEPFPSNWRGQDRTQDSATARVDLPEPQSSNGWTLPKYPSLQNYGQPRNNLVYNQNIYANVPTPRPALSQANRGPSIYTQDNTKSAAAYDTGFINTNPSPPNYPPTSNQYIPPPSNPNFPVNNRIDADSNLMSPYLEVPPPPPSQQKEAAQDLFFSDDNSVASDLQRLFAQRKEDSFSPFRRTSTEPAVPTSPSPYRNNARNDDSRAESSDGFWNVMQNRLKQPDRTTEGIKQPAHIDLDAELERLLKLERQATNQIQLEEMGPLHGKQANPHRQGNVVINNFGTSGMKPVTARPYINSPTSTVSNNFVDVLVPKNQNGGFFGVGSSLSFNSGTKKGSIQNSLINSFPSINQEQVIAPEYSRGDDPNIIYPHQITPGTNLRQGPQGPIISSPGMPNLSIPQTPDAPIMTPTPDRYDYPGISPGQQARIPNPRRVDVPSPRPPPQGRSPRPQYSQGSPSPNQYGQGSPSPKLNQASRAPSFNLQRRTDRVPQADRPQKSERKQDLISSLVPAAIIPAAIGLGSAGISPVGIFSNLLNAYATIDSKHDLTGKLINGAASFFQGPGDIPTVVEDVVNIEEKPEDLMSNATTTTTTSSFENVKVEISSTVLNSTPTTQSTTRTTTTPFKPSRYVPTPTNVRVKDKVSTFSYSSEDEEEYYSLLQKIRSSFDGNDNYNTNNAASEIDVVYDEYFPAKSNLSPNGPLRAKPPSDDIVQVSPSPNLYGNKQYGVNNPNWFSNNVPSSTPGYGPDDFVVETVNLDKNFFYQFFTSKPMILDTDVVTSKSQEVTYNGYYPAADKRLPYKKGRETLSNIPEHLAGKQILPEHILKKTGEAVEESTEAASLPTLLNKSKFRRYNVPPEVRITHGVSLPEGRSFPDKEATENQASK